MTVRALDTQPLRDRVDRQSPVPMYDQLGGLITDEITRQGLAEGDLLPGEHGLCEAFGVSRTVVRRALADLERDGTIRRVRGKGTFVGDHKTAERFVHSVRGLHEDATARGSVVRSEVLRQEIAPAPTEVALALDVPPEAPVVVLERLRFVDDEPWSWSTTWLPERLAELVLAADLTRGSLYALLSAHGSQPASSTRTVEAALATAAQAERLGIVQVPVVMVLRSVTLTADGRPLEYFVAHHRGDRSRFEFATVPVADEG